MVYAVINKPFLINELDVRVTIKIAMMKMLTTVFIVEHYTI